MRAPHGATTLELGWSDGETSRIPHWILRGFCPCAGCQGHDGAVGFVEATASLSGVALEIRVLRQVGGYALGFTWGDGHDAGIYSFEHLRWLGSLAAAPPEAVRAARTGR